MPEFWQGYAFGIVTGILVCVIIAMMLRVHMHLNINVRRPRRTLPTPPPVHTWDMTTTEKKPDE